MAARSRWAGVEFVRRGRRHVTLAFPATRTSACSHAATSARRVVMHHFGMDPVMSFTPSLTMDHSARKHGDVLADQVHREQWPPHERIVWLNAGLRPSPPARR